MNTNPNPKCTIVARNGKGQRCKHNVDTTVTVYEKQGAVRIALPLHYDNALWMKRDINVCNQHHDMLYKGKDLTWVRPIEIPNKKETNVNINKEDAEADAMAEAALAKLGAKPKVEKVPFVSPIEVTETGPICGNCSQGMGNARVVKRHADNAAVKACSNAYYASIGRPLKNTKVATPTNTVPAITEDIPEGVLTFDEAKAFAQRNPGASIHKSKNGKGYVVTATKA